jgi:lysine 2,3-aminomutase
VQQHWKEKQRAFRKRTLRILGPVPQIRDILLAEGDLETKRNRIRTALTAILVNSYEKRPDIPSLEWVLTHDAVEAWHNLCSRRNESLAEFSFLDYLEALANGRPAANQPAPKAGFFAELEWNNWQWHCRRIVRDADTLASLVRLSNEEYLAVKTANESKVPFGITPYYLTLLDNRPDSPSDQAVRAQVIPSMHYVQSMAGARQQGCSSMDFMLEQDTSPIEAVTRRYPNIVILKPVLTCPQICVYCQRNWQIEDVHSKRAAVSSKVLNRAIDWIAKNREINEVLITGGDPFLLSNSRIEQLMRRLCANANIVRIRIGTRTPVTLPQRITDGLAKIVARYQIPGKREVVIVTHFEHLYEITPDAMEAAQKFRRQGIEIYNQLVYTFFNSRKFELAALRQKLRLIGVTPYYTFNTKGKDETNDFRVPIARLLQEQKEEARLLPGTVRTDKVVFNVPRLGKNYLDASQHHNIISILPDGRRVYEFHPWEKKLTLVDTYIYTDVSIFDYLKRLRAAGEESRHYRSIWYYY